MKHFEIVQLLPWYVNGTLDKVERRAVRAHIKACPRCAHEVNALKLVGARVRALGDKTPAPSHDPIARILREIRMVEPPRETAGEESEAQQKPRHLHRTNSGLFTWLRRPFIPVTVLAGMLLFFFLFPLEPTLKGEMIPLTDSLSEEFTFLRTVRGDQEIQLEPGRPFLSLKLEIDLGLDDPANRSSVYRCDLKQEDESTPVATVQGPVIPGSFGLKFPADKLPSGYYTLEVYGLPNAPDQPPIEIYYFKLQRK